MQNMILRHGCLILGFAACPAAADESARSDAAKVQTRRFEIEYQANEEALPLTRVELWYSRDRGQTWHNFGSDGDLQSPIQFDAAEEGLYGFYFVLANRIGVSTPPPLPETEPQQWAFVDYTPPIVQLRLPVMERDAGAAVVRVRWSALDANFDVRPIEIAYRPAPEGEWKMIAHGLANTGAYDWRPPAELAGWIALRLTALDLGGHRIDVVSDPFELIARPTSGDSGLATSQPSNAQDSLSEADLARADQVFRRGVSHRERGEYRLAVSRFRDALAINPRMTDALVNLGETLYFQRQYDESVQAYRLALEQSPSSLDARRGTARSLIAAKRYEEAAEELALLLDSAPQDAQAWLDHGDVALWRGDQALARESWRRVAAIDGRPDEVAERARVRLTDIEGISPWNRGARRP